MLNRFFQRAKANDASQTPKSRRLQLENLENRELLSVAPWDTAAEPASKAAVVATVETETLPTLDLSSLSAPAAVSASTLSADPTNSTSATSLTVTTNLDVVDANDGVLSLREAISAAASGSTITFDASLKGKTFLLSGTQLEITQDVTVDASELYDAATDTPGIAIDANEQSRVFSIDGGTANAPVTLIGLTITGGVAVEGGGVYFANDATATLENCRITDNVASGEGGGAFADFRASATFAHCSIFANSAGAGGGVAAFYGSETTFENCVVEGNLANEGGGFALTGGTADFTNCEIIDNRAGVAGGGLYLLYGTAELAGVLIACNEAESGGGVYADASGANFANCTIAANVSEFGGLNVGENGAAVLRNSIVVMNGDYDVYVQEKASAKAFYTMSTYSDWNVGESNYLYDASLPLFVDANVGDFALAVDSQALQRGNDAYAVDPLGNVLEVDLNGERRVFGAAVDLGAYEAQVGEEKPSLLVNSNGDSVNPYDGRITLREALLYAERDPSLGDAIAFAPSMKGRTITLVGTELEIKQGITIDASALYDAENNVPGITISGDGLSRVFHISGGTTDAPVELIGLTITGGYSLNNGGGVYVAHGETAFTDCSIIGNRAVGNGYVGAGTALGGGVYIQSGAPTFTNCVVEGNVAEGSGTRQGGGIYLNAGSPTFVDCSITGNASRDGHGGGVYIKSGTPSFTSCSVTGNNASWSDGGGIYVANGASSFTSCSVVGNSASYSGGGIYVVNGASSFTSCSVVGNSANSGGGICVGDGASSFASCSVVGNSSRSGGGIYVANGTPSFRNCSVSGNTGQKGGGLGVGGGAPTFANGEVVGNDAYGDWANAYGGGVYVSGGKATLTNCTVAGNAATCSHDNYISRGGGVFVETAGTAAFYNSIVALNYTEHGREVEGALSAASSNNLIGVDPEFVVGPEFDAAGNLANADALDLRLTAKSRAIDRGDNSFSANDLIDMDGGDRIARSWAATATVDLGAYEYVGAFAKTPETPSLVVTTSSDVVDDTDGAISLREALLYVACDPSLGDAITFDPSLKGKTITLSGWELFATGVKIDASALYDAEKQEPGIVLNANALSRCISVATGTLELIGLKLTGGQAGRGGAVYVSDGTLKATDCFFVGNNASYYGGAVYAEASVATFTNCSISGNTASASGGGVCVSGGQTATFANCSIAGNSAGGTGGGVYVARNSSSTFTNCSISENLGKVNGGGVCVAEGQTATFTGCAIVGNRAYDSYDGYGGGVYVNNETSTFANCVVAENTARYDGGGVYTRGTTTLTNCSISGNAASYGGGVYVYGTTTLTSVELSANVANEYGGGVYVRNSTSANATLRYCTIAGNSAEVNGGGITVEQEGTATLRGSIVALNNTTQGCDLQGGLAAGSANNLIGVDPKFVVGPVFDDQGNLTNAASLDLRLTAKSWAIDRGGVANFPGSKDLGGGERVVKAWADEATIDIGAYEYQTEFVKTPETPSLVVTTSSDVVDDTDGAISLREALLYVAYDKEIGTVITFAPELKGKTIALSGSELYASKGTVDASALYDVNRKKPGLTIDAKGRSRVFSVYGCGSLELIGLKATGGSAYDGGAVYVYRGAADFTDCVIAGNAALRDGGAVYAYSGSTKFTNVVLSDNVASRDGGAVYGQEGTVATFFGTSALNNVALNGGGGAVCFFKGTQSFTDCVIAGNVAKSYGGGVRVESGTATLTNCSVQDNTSQSSNGGGVYGYNETLTLANGSIAKNIAYAGGGVHNNGTTTFTNCAIVDNSATEWGGGVRVWNSNFTGCAISGNWAKYGGGIYFESGTLNFANGALVDNEATDGAGFYAYSGGATFRNATIAGNEAGNKGGGLYFFDREHRATLYNSIVALNVAPDGAEVYAGRYRVDAFRVLSSYSDWANGDVDDVVNYLYNASQPLFKDAANGDYTLPRVSQAVDKGDDAQALDAVGVALTTDLAGDERFVETVDLGAYERQVDKSIPTLTVETRGVSGLTLTIGYVAGATSYPVEYSTDPNFETDVLTRVFSSSGVKKLSNLSPNTTYYVRVKGGESGEWSDAKFAATNPIRCAAPTLAITHRDSTSHTVSIGFSSGATGYVMEYSTDPTFETYSTKAYTSNGAKKFADFPTDSTVYVRVKAEGTGAYVDSSYSTTILVLGRPTFALAQRGTDGTALTLTLDYVAGATKYVVDYSTDATFATYSTREFTSNGSKKLSGLQAGTTYFVRVTAYGADGNVASFVSATQSQTTYGAASSAAVSSSALSDAFADLFAEESEEDDFWFELEEALKR